MCLTIRDPPGWKEMELPEKFDADDYETLPTERMSIHMVAGAFAGIMEHCVMFPVDSVKVNSTWKEVHFEFCSISIDEHGKPTLTNN